MLSALPQLNIQAAQGQELTIVLAAWLQSQGSRRVTQWDLCLLWKIRGGSYSCTVRMVKYLLSVEKTWKSSVRLEAPGYKYIELAEMEARGNYQRL